MRWNDFSAGGAKLVKSNRDNQIQNITLRNRHFAMGSGVLGQTAKPQKLENFREFLC